MTAMAAVSDLPRMTRAEFLALPEKDDARIYELIDGQVVVADPNREHQMVALELAFALRAWTGTDGARGLVTLTLDTAVGEEDVLIPNLQWFAPGRELPDPRTRPVPLGDVVIEIRSPSTWHRDVGVKLSMYEAEGAQELWLVDPLAKTVDCLRRSSPESTSFDTGASFAEDDDLVSPLLDGFAVRVADLFRTP